MIRREWARRLAWLPILLLLLTMAVLWVADLPGSHEAPTLQMILNFFTRTLATMFIFLLAGRGFLVRGAPGLLLLGCGVGIWGAAGLVTTAVASRDANLGVTISNLGVWVSALCHLTGVVVSLRWERKLRSVGLWLAIGYAAALGVVGLLTLGAFAGWLPVFFVQGQGGTLVRHIVLGSATAMFVLTAVLVWEGNRPSSPFAYWYMLALLLIATGLFGLLFESSRNSVLDWTCRTALYLSGVYMLIAALASDRESRWRSIIPDRAISEGRYRYGVAIALVLAATALRLVVLQAAGTRAIFVTFYPAVILAALYGGVRAGLLASLLSVLAADYFWIGSLRFAKGGQSDWISMAVFLLSCTMISAITETMHRAHRRAAEAKAEARAAAERERAADAILESEERLRQAADLVGLCPYLWDVVTGALEWNERLRAMWGLPPDATVDYQVWLAGVHPEDRAWVEKLVARSLDPSGDGIYEAEYRVNGADGVQRWVSVRGRTRFAGGKPVSHLGVAVEVTERKRAEEALRAKDAELELILNRTPFMLTRCSRDLHYRYASRAYAQMIGRTPDGVAGKPIVEIMGERGFETIRPHVEAVLQGQTVEYEAAVEFTGVGVRQLRVIYVPDRDEQQRVIGWIASIIDITERRRAEEALRRSEERLRLAKSAGKIGIHDFDPVSGALHWDERVRELWGVGLDDPVNYDVFIAGVHPDDRAATDAAVQRALDPAGDGNCYVEYRLVRNSQIRWIAATGRVMFEGGRAVRLIGTVQDITERKEFQAELERLVAERTAKLLELVEELEHFSYTITHDMRAPLRAMRGFEELVDDLCAECAHQERKEFIRRIMISTERMDALIRDALNYSQSVRQELPLEQVDSGALLRGMLDSYPELQASKAHISIEGNAVKFVKPGEMPEIRIWAEARDGWARIWVEDKGIGISKEMLPRVFDMFSRASKNYEGTGIRLALVRKVAQRMGGKVGVESEEGKGSRFWLELRLGKGERRPKAEA